MNSSDNGQSSSGGGASLGKLKAGGGLLGVLAVVYALLQPILSEKLGVELPRIPVAPDKSPVASSDHHVSDSKRSEEDGSSLASKIKVTSDRETSKKKESAVRGSQKKGDSSPTKQAEKSDSKSTMDVSSSKSSPAKSSPKIASGGPLSQRIRPPPSESTKSSPAKSSPGAGNSSKSASNLKYGILQPLGRDNYMSPAGLRYTPGSAEGHRLKHLERHTKDQPNRPGKHGVFDGGMKKALEVLDQAYEKAKRNDRTVKTKDQGRTIYTVDMGKRVGYVGGRDGNRMRKPMARRVRMVLEGTRVITAYPM